MARLRRQWAVQTARAWSGTTGEPLTWGEPRWTTDKAEADAILAAREKVHARQAEGSWEWNQTQCRMITRVVSIATVVPRG